jgi:hypothetical protein
MRVLILNTDYEAFLEAFYAASPGLADRTYDEQMAARNLALFGVADFYSQGLKANGVDAEDLHLNNCAMQLRWAAENGVPIEENAQGAESRGIVAMARRLFGSGRNLTPQLAAMPGWMRDVMTAQIETFRPDVILNQVMHFVSAASLRSLVGRRCLLVGQIAAPWHEPADDKNYDLIVTSLPNYVSRFRQRGIPAHYSKLGFALRVLAEVPETERRLPVTFVGTLSVHHDERIRLLEYLASRTELNVWGMGIDEVPEASPLRNCYRGQAWGRGMFSIFRRSQIVVNQHIGIAGEYANNMRLYEATGCGAALVTDRKSNLHELFDVGSEVVDYGNPDECLAQIEHLLSDSVRCANIGRTGQERTCRDHTYLQRAAELAAVFAGAAR